MRPCRLRGSSVPDGRSPVGPSTIGLCTDVRATSRTRQGHLRERAFPSELTTLKGEPDTHRQKGRLADAPTSSHRCGDSAFDAFFEKRGRFLCFAKKAGHFAFRIPQRVKVKEGKVYVPKVRLGPHPRQSRALEGTTKSATFKRDACGHWYVALTMEFEIPRTFAGGLPSGQAVGVDLGLKDLFVLSDGERVLAPWFARKRAANSSSERIVSKKPESSQRESKHQRDGRRGGGVSDNGASFSTTD